VHGAVAFWSRVHGACRQAAYGKVGRSSAPKLDVRAPNISTIGALQHAREMEDDFVDENLWLEDDYSYLRLVRTN
jgi:hypothetical protein